MERPNYTGKPTVYLDHNILDFFIKFPNNALENEILDKYQVVYSDETLREVKRTGERGQQFLDLLRKLSAMHISIEISPSFDSTGKAIVKEIDPNTAYQSYIENLESVYESIIHSTSQSLLKFYGGRKESTLEQISNEQLDSFFSLMDHILEQATEIQDSHPSIHQAIISQVENFKRQYTGAQRESLRVMQEHETEDGAPTIQTLRDCTGLGPKQLNNITAPNVIEKIWSLHQVAPGYREYNFSIEQFLGISRTDFQHRDMHLHEKITACYNVLNVVGFHQDSNLKSEKRFTAATSDAGHAAIASFANHVFSNDSAFIKKTQAVYDYLGVTTKVTEVIINRAPS
ncbi:hypothetical protein [Pseudomonas sp. PDM19]|uniref:hypothetical protein n=1 Tax=Pseudomonas sp. PDM19 TaxID=2769272 RepID=UPI00177F7702|nr:hypothetical protein [Pseudomonas sp. PDM19]MBD9633622.1 hypothetical protein [Pseudomonas sp. PDM19]